jgi:hypothetical protein
LPTAVPARQRATRGATGDAHEAKDVLHAVLVRLAAVGAFKQRPLPITPTLP